MGFVNTSRVWPSLLCLVNQNCIELSTMSAQKNKSWSISLQQVKLKQNNEWLCPFCQINDLVSNEKHNQVSSGLIACCFKILYFCVPLGLSSCVRRVTISTCKDSQMQCRLWIQFTKLAYFVFILMFVGYSEAVTASWLCKTCFC